jgi:hypothetical protein
LECKRRGRQFRRRGGELYVQAVRRFNFCSGYESIFGISALYCNNLHIYRKILLDISVEVWYIEYNTIILYGGRYATNAIFAKDAAEKFQAVY